MLQAELANKIDVSSKAISKWEIFKGLLDIWLIESLSVALGVSAMELLKGNTAINQNKSVNLICSKLHIPGRE